MRGVNDETIACPPAALTIVKEKLIDMTPPAQDKTGNIGAHTLDGPYPVRGRKIEPSTMLFVVSIGASLCFENFSQGDKRLRTPDNKEYCLECG